jgi:hypothetical protein
LVLWNWFQRRPQQPLPGFDGPPGPERRRSARHPSRFKALLQPISLAQAPRISVRIRDVSMGGIGLLSPERVPPEKFIVVTVRNSTLGFDFTVRAVVLRVTRQEECWLLSCAFLKELNEEQLRFML